MHKYQILNWFVRFRLFFCDRKANAAGLSGWLGCGSGRGLQWNRTVCTQQYAKERRLSFNTGNVKPLSTQRAAESSQWHISTL